MRIVGDVKVVLTELLKVIEDRPWSEWNDQIVEWKRLFPLAYPQDGQLYAEYIIDMINEVTNGEAIMTTDVGQHQMWAAQHFKCRRPRQWVTSGGLGTMGFGLPAAVGVQAAFPDKTVINLSGDGSFQMCVQELMTATVYELPVINVIINNRSLGMVRQWQELFYKERYSHVDLQASPDFVKLVEAYGGVGMRITKPEEVRDALEAAIKIRNRPVVIDCVVPTSENVYPMIPSGESVDQMRVREDLEELKASVHADAEVWSYSDEDRVLSNYARTAEAIHGSEKSNG